MGQGQELIRALQSKQYSKAKRLIDEGADAKTRGQWGYTPLHYAAMNTLTYDARQRIAEGMPEAMAKLLINRGAIVDARTGQDAGDLSEATPLHFAAFSGNTGVVKLLIANRANVNAKAKAGITPVIMAIEERRLGAAEVLLRHGAKLEPSDIRDKRRRPQDIWGGATLLHRSSGSIDRSSLFVVELLISLGADVNARDDHGRTPLMDAVLGSYGDVLALLLAKGANAGYQDRDGETALSIAEQGSGRGWAIPVLQGPANESALKTAAPKLPAKRWWKIWT
jgi:cytohesin